MKIKQLLPVFAAITLGIGLHSCKKADTSGTDELETTFELSGDQAIADNLTEDANDVFMEIAVDNNVAGNFAPQTVETTNIIACATVTVTPLVGFPKTIVIDFGTSCTHNGIVRSGKITAPDGRYWLHSGIKYVNQTAGVATPFNLLDDVFAITGSHSVTNAAGRTRDCTVLEALQKKVICSNIDKGKLKVQGPNHYAVIDFGDGSCDNLATISIDGRAPRTIILR